MKNTNSKFSSLALKAPFTVKYLFLLYVSRAQYAYLVFTPPCLSPAPGPFYKAALFLYVDLHVFV